MQPEPDVHASPTMVRRGEESGVSGFPGLSFPWHTDERLPSLHDDRVGQIHPAVCAHGCGPSRLTRSVVFGVHSDSCSDFVNPVK